MRWFLLSVFIPNWDYAKVCFTVNNNNQLICLKSGITEEVARNSASTDMFRINLIECYIMSIEYYDNSKVHFWKVSYIKSHKGLMDSFYYLV